MPVITLQDSTRSFEESDVITFPEGLIGLPEMKRAVVVPMEEFEPSCWLASVESDDTRFIVVDPHDIFTGYEPFVKGKENSAGLQTLVIVKISSDWRKTTVNLRAPIFINGSVKSGAQHVLTDSTYRFAEELPENK